MIPIRRLTAIPSVAWRSYPSCPSGLTSLRCSPTFPSPDPNHLYALVESMSSLLESYIPGDLFIFCYCPQAQCSGSWLLPPCQCNHGELALFPMSSPHCSSPAVSSSSCQSIPQLRLCHLLPSLCALQVKKPPDSDSMPHFFPLILVAAHNHSGTSWSRLPTTSMLCGPWRLLSFPSPSSVITWTHLLLVLPSSQGTPPKRSPLVLSSCRVGTIEVFISHC